MQDLKNRPLASSSATSEAPTESANEAEAVNAAPEPVPAPSPAPISARVIEVNGAVRPEIEEASYTVAVPADVPAAEAAELAPEREIEAMIDEDAGEREAEPVRSLQMQIRFGKTLLYFLGLFARLLYWHWLMPKLRGEEYVRRGNLPRWQGYARKFAAFAIDMGGVMIKLGQFISTRVDILPPEVTNELAGLRDEVPSVPFEQMRAIIEHDLGPIPERFRVISEKPVAAASLGQVHRAKLLNGERVVVKVRRPGIVELCYTDLAAMRVVARIAMRFPFIANRANAPALVDEFGRVLLEELSYRQEARNAMRFAEIFKNNMGVYIPAVYVEHSSDRIVTMEDVTTIKIDDYTAIEAAGISRKAVAQRLMDTYLLQVFEERFFHADPHPGNLFVYPLPTRDGQPDTSGNRPFYLIFIDFGMTGSLTQRISSGLIETIMAVFSADPKRLIRSYKELGVLMPGADTERLEEAASLVFKQMWGMNVSQMSGMSYEEMSQLGKQFNDLLYDMPFQMPQDFIYLSRTFSILSGMALALDPTFNPWDEIQPYVRKLMTRGLVASTAAKAAGSANTIGGIGTLLEAGQGIIRMIGNRGGADAVIQRLESGDIKLVAELNHRQRRQLARVEAQSRRTTRAVIFGSILIVSTMLFNAGHVAPAVIGYAASALTLVSLLMIRAD